VMELQVIVTVSPKQRPKGSLLWRPFDDVEVV
jgi:hypothetical protein